MYKRYECPTNPDLTMFGKGGMKEFKEGIYITNDPLAQEFLEGHDRFEIPNGIHLTGEAADYEALGPKPVSILDQAPPGAPVMTRPEVELGADGATVIIGEDGKPQARPRKGDSLKAVIDENAALDLTPEQRVKIAFLAAGFPKGTELDPIAAELGINLEEVTDATELADLVEDKLAPMIADRRMEKDAAAPPEPSESSESASGGEAATVPTRTRLRRATSDELTVIANLHKVPDRIKHIGSAKGLRSLLLKHFHGIEG